MPSLKTDVDRLWDQAAIPALEEYIRIPAISPAYDAHWESQGHLRQSLELALEWFHAQNFPQAAGQILEAPGRTPLLILDIPPSHPQINGTTLLYGHMDKQPPAQGWDENKGPWTPVMENNRLYGRGGGDDGYALFSALIAIKSLQLNQRPHGRCVILIETCEESGSFDLEHYLTAHQDLLPSPDLVICLDSDIWDWDRMWVTTSLRGLIEGELSVSLLDQPIHSGNSGMVASGFRVMRQLLDRIEDARTGALHIDELNPPIPDQRTEQAQQAAQVLARPISADVPLLQDAQPVTQDPAEMILNITWKPALSYIASQGFPPPDNAANVLRPDTRFTLSFRSPPTADTGAACRRLEQVLEADPPHGAQTRFKVKGHSSGWEMPGFGNELDKRLREIAQECFGHAPCFKGQGGSIPFMTLLSRRFPLAKILIIGVMGPSSNAHGPNEFLDIPYVKKLTASVAQVLAGFSDC